MKILLIDDSRVLRMVHEKALTRAGFDVTCATDGEEGLRVARDQEPDLILLDLMLPKVGGQDVLRTLKCDVRTKHIPVIVISGLSRSNAAKLIEQGAIEFLEKTDDLLDSNSQGIVRTVQGVLSRTTQLKEIGWH